MKHLLLSGLLIFTLFSCEQRPKRSNADKIIEDSQRFLDSLNIARQADSITKDIVRNAHFDTLGISTAPVKILKARIVRREYSSYKDIQLTYKNVSDKNISAIRFKWFGENSFGEPAEMGSYTQEGFGGGYDDEGLRKGNTVTNQWSILSRDAKKVVIAWPYEIVFSDGSRWKSTNN